MDKRTEFVISLLTKLFVWGSLFAVLYLLRTFSLLIFLVFIFSYFQSNAVDRLKPYIANRTVRVVVVGVSFLATVVIAMSVLIPQIRYQAVNFINNSTHYAQSIDRELVSLTDRYPALERLLPEAGEDHTVPILDDLDWKFRNSMLARIVEGILPTTKDGLDPQSVSSILQAARDMGTALLAFSSQFVLSILFSFLIVLDLPNLSAGAKSLKNTKLRFMYEEVADSLVRFGHTMGRAFEAQFLVAAVNTILTAAGIWLIHIRQEIAFISLIVFLCGFIPIAGVFISSIPICLLALANGGLPKLGLAIVLISLVHAVESYILNPRIFGSHMKLNPVVVMILMTVSGKLFGVWGLVLCLPITTYLFQDAIQYRDEDKEDTIWADEERPEPVEVAAPVREPSPPLDA